MKHLFPVLLLLQSSLLFAQHNITLLARKTYSEDLSDVWGYAANGKEYALVGVHSGVSIVDVTNPATPTELFFVPTASSDWHDIATWNGFAYVTNETGGGLTIIDLNFLPDSISTNTWTGGSLAFNTGHTVFTDENGIAYIAGGNNSAGRGILMLDVNANPTNPPLVGRYDVHYVHDVFVRGDTMWTAEINNGIFSVVDISNKANPVILTTNSTPSNKTHNTWVSADGNTLLTTDEVTNSYIASYDVSDLGNIQLLDLYQSNSGSGSIGHNVHYRGEFAVISYYRDGVVIVDASNPKNLIEVGNYDTTPLSGSGFNGVWSVYPYLPSGNLLASDIELGLFVLGATYQKACYLEGKVTDISNGAALNNVTVTILPTNPSELTNLAGEYKTGIADSGTYSVQFQKAGYQTHTENNVILKNGIVTTLNVQMIPAVPITLTGSVFDVSNGQKNPFSHVLLENSINAYQTETDSNGDFSIDSFETGIYNVFAGKWGFLTRQQSINIFSQATIVAVGLQSGYYDDFIFDFDWTATSTAASGNWERAQPVGTDFNGEVSNPDTDVPDDFGSACFVTGNGGGSAGDDDVDDGSVTLTSPVFNLSNFNDPFITYSLWFFNDGGSSSPNDSLIVTISNGADTAMVDVLTAATGNNGWNAHTFRVKDFLPLSSTMTMQFTTRDNSSSGHLVEAGVDFFFVVDSNFIQVPVVDFTADKNESCPGESFVFTDSSANAPTNWFWEFPGAMPPSSTEQNPTVVFPNAAAYSITLSATNSAGTNSLTKIDFLIVHETPTVESVVTDASSATSADGSVDFFISGGVAPYQILWSNGSLPVGFDNLLPGDYAIFVTDSFGCSTIDSFTVGVNTSIHATTNVQVTFYPNPFSETISFTSNENLQIAFYNSVGVKVDETNLVAGTHLQWGENQKAGVYFAFVKNERKFETLKIVKSE